MAVDGSRNRSSGVCFELDFRNANKMQIKSASSEKRSCEKPFQKKGCPQPQDSSRCLGNTEPEKSDAEGCAFVVCPARHSLTFFFEYLIFFGRMQSRIKKINYTP